MNRSIFRRMLPAFVLTLGGLVASANGFGGTVDMATLLANPSFELGNQVINPSDLVGCPVGWSCLGSPSPGGTAYTVTAAQFTAGSDGLASGIVPDGTSAALCPTIIEGSCQLSQTKLGTYAAGTTYTLNLWVGTPATMPFDQFGNPDNKSKTAEGQRLTFYWVGNGNGQMQATDIALPPPGKWTSTLLTFTPTGNQIGQSIGIIIFYNSGNNYQPVNFDIDPPCTCAF
jgi:hypothetical protein